MSCQDTIAAIATPPGRGGVAIVRVSGPDALAIGDAVTQQKLRPRHAHYLPFIDADETVIDQGIALAFSAPHSFTGEDVLELQGHGGPVVMDLLLNRVLALGARLANPGEFSERAFLNDKVDLSQAEAIADLINAGSEQAARSAIRSLQGAFSQHIETISQQLIELRMHVESAIDFPEEEIDFLSDDKLSQRLQTVLASIEKLQAQASQGQLLRDGIKVVIAGKPNAGKSSLLNVLCGAEVAIVTDIPGTTRDLVQQQISLDGIPIHLTDTAGLRDTSDAVERIGVERAQAEIEQADVILLVEDASKPSDFIGENDRCLSSTTNCPSEGWGPETMLDPQISLNPAKTLLIRNKIDLTKESSGRSESTPQHTPTTINISATQRQGIDDLKKAIKTLVGATTNNETAIIARRRHLNAIERAREHLQGGWAQLHEYRAGELLAEECRLAQQCLSEITGKFTPDDLLGEIFSSFCIGK